MKLICPKCSHETLQLFYAKNDMFCTWGHCHWGGPIPKLLLKAHKNLVKEEAKLKDLRELWIEEGKDRR